MNIETLIKELEFSAVRSGGPGGQHANKVSSRIILTFQLINSKAFSEREKGILLQNIKNRLSKNGVLILSCSESRSQHQNKEIIIKRFLQIVKAGILIPKKRKGTRPTKASVKRRLANKKRIAIIKSHRKKPSLE